MKRAKKKFKKPIKPWNKERMGKESIILKTYGLRRKHEIWKAESMLRSFRRRARNLAVGGDEAEKKILLDKLHSMGVLSKTADLDDEEP